MHLAFDKIPGMVQQANALWTESGDGDPGQTREPGGRPGLPGLTRGVSARSLRGICEELLR